MKSDIWSPPGPRSIPDHIFQPRSLPDSGFAGPICEPISGTNSGPDYGSDSGSDSGFRGVRLRPSFQTRIHVIMQQTLDQKWIPMLGSRDSVAAQFSGTDSVPEAWAEGSTGRGRECVE